MELISSEALISLIVPLAKEWLKPETLLKDVDWLRTTAKSFLAEKPIDNEAPNLPSARPIQVGRKEAGKTDSFLRIRMELDAFNLNLMQREVSSSMSLIERHVKNLQYLSQQAALYGGEQLLPISLKNQIDLQRKAIIENLIDLSDLIYKLYGVKKDEMNQLAKVLETF